MNSFLFGALSMSYLVAALFFLRFWRSTRDRFFLFFSLSFLIQAVNRVIQTLVDPTSEKAPVIYLIRLVAFGLILYAIADKNRPDRQRNKPAPDLSEGG